jgi:hypothetical protein
MNITLTAQVSAAEKIDGSQHQVNERKIASETFINFFRSPPAIKPTSVNLVGATNSPKVAATSIKQQLPLKLSSLSK